MDYSMQSKSLAAYTQLGCNEKKVAAMFEKFNGGDMGVYGDADSYCFAGVLVGRYSESGNDFVVYFDPRDSRQALVTLNEYIAFSITDDFFATDSHKSLSLADIEITDKASALLGKNYFAFAKFCYAFENAIWSCVLPDRVLRTNNLLTDEMRAGASFCSLEHNQTESLFIVDTAAVGSLIFCIVHNPFLDKTSCCLLDEVHGFVSAGVASKLSQLKTSDVKGFSDKKIAKPVMLTFNVGMITKSGSIQMDEKDIDAQIELNSALERYLSRDFGSSSLTKANRINLTLNYGALLGLYSLKRFGDVLIATSVDRASTHIMKLKDFPEFLYRSKGTT